MHRGDIPQSKGQNSPTRVFFDITGTVEHLRKHINYTGIQRTSTNIIANIIRYHGCNTDNNITFFNRKTSEFLSFPVSEIEPEDVLSYDRLRQRLGIKARRGRVACLQRYWGNSAAYYFHRTRLDLSYIMGRESSFRRYSTSRKGWKEARFGPRSFLRPVVTRKLEDVSRAGDKIVLLDAVWANYQMQALANCKAKGLKIFSFIYDMIPTKMPSHTQENTSFLFHDWLLKSREYVDHFIAISASCRDDYLKAFGEQEGEASVFVLPLAQTKLETAVEPGAGSAPMNVSALRFPELYAIADVSPPVREAAFAPFVLCVGTIEGRKNGWRLVMAWKSLIESGNPDLPRLVFAGRPGWCSSALQDVLNSTGNLYGYVTVLQSPSDEDLAFLYRRCQFLVMPSLYEGWGLPVGEALSYGKTAVISNVASLPEVGGNLVEYCDPESIGSISAAIMRLISEPGRREELENRIARERLRDWEDVARDLLDVLS